MGGGQIGDIKRSWFKLVSYVVLVTTRPALKAYHQRSAGNSIKGR